MKSIKSIVLAMLVAGLAAALLLSATAWISGERMQSQARRVFIAKDVTADILPPPLYLIEVRLTLSQALDGTLTPAEASKIFDRLAADHRTRTAYWRKNTPFGLEKHLLGAQHEAAQNFLDAAKKDVLEPLVIGNVDAARSALPAVHKLYEAHRAGVDKTVEASNAFADENIAGFDAVERSARQWCAAILAGTLLACIALYIGARRRLQVTIASPLQRACQAAERIATGDLTANIHVHGRDEAALMLHALADMQANLRHVVGNVRTGVDGIAAASTQIAQGSGDLSTRTEKQTSSLQQTAAAMEQITVTVRTSADNARQANRLAAHASVLAAKGGEVVTQVVATMGDIQSASGKIGDIIGVIDSIAFQTNILALNAAVEAARAGEQGRGFAVVAGEVRSLAQRATEAAREIKALIGTSVEKVDAGSTLVIEAGTTMAEIVAQVRKVTGLIGEISAVADEQNNGLGQVNTAVGQLDEMTQRNAALVEQSAAAAESLKRQAHKLREAVAVFRLGAGEGRTVTAA